MKSSKLPIEITIVNKSEINPWRYPPTFDFQYGDWLRKEFENGNVEPWLTKEMPDLALLITKVLLASQVLFGPDPGLLLCAVPYRDLILADKTELQNLMSDLNTYTRNVLLGYARIWSRLETDSIRSKPAAALWAMNHLPQEYRPVLERVRSICIGETMEYWDDIRHLIHPCVDFMVSHINQKISLIESSNYIDRSIRLAE